jgi:hypothetical protein
MGTWMQNLHRVYRALALSLVSLTFKTIQFYHSETSYKISCQLALYQTWNDPILTLAMKRHILGA